MTTRDTPEELTQEQANMAVATALQRENNALRNIVKGVHGALMDAGDIPMPGMDDDLYDPVMTVVTQRNHLRAQLAEANLRHDNLVKMLEEEHARLAETEAALAESVDTIYALITYPEAHGALAEKAKAGFLKSLPESTKQDAKFGLIIKYKWK